MSLDSYTLLVFIAGVLAGVGAGFTVRAMHEHLEIRRYLRTRRRLSG